MMKETPGKLEVSIPFGTFQRALKRSTGFRTNFHELQNDFHGVQNPDMDKQAKHLEGNTDSQAKNAQMNITDNKKIELNTVHKEAVHPRWIWKTL